MDMQGTDQITSTFCVCARKRGCVYGGSGVHTYMSTRVDLPKTEAQLVIKFKGDKQYLLYLIHKDLKDNKYLRNKKYSVGIFEC